MSGFAFTVAMTVVVRVEDVDEYALAEGGLELADDELGDYSLDDVKARVAGSLAGFTLNEVNNCAEMPMWMASADATVTEVAEL